MSIVFIYGTLKRGFALHDQGIRGAPFLGAYRTVEPYPMFVAGPWYGPMMLDRPGVGLPVQGEAYEVDAAQLARIDEVENLGEPGNLRIALNIERLEGGDRRIAFAYPKSPEMAVPAHTGYLADYHDHRFIPPDQRR